MTKTCLLIVDVQNDFCPGGALAVPNGDVVVAGINRIMSQFDIVVATRDMHPSETAHFNKWPPHCIAGTPGAAFHPDLDTSGIDFFVEKGTRPGDDGYSGFEATDMDLDKLLRDHNIESVTICGLATDYCVYETAMAAVKRGFKTTVLTDCIRAVNVEEGDGERALRKMAAAGVMLK